MPTRNQVVLDSRRRDGYPLTSASDFTITLPDPRQTRPRKIRFLSLAVPNATPNVWSTGVNSGSLFNGNTLTVYMNTNPGGAVTVSVPQGYYTLSQLLTYLNNWFASSSANQPTDQFTNHWLPVFYFVAPTYYGAGGPDTTRTANADCAYSDANGTNRVVCGFWQQGGLVAQFEAGTIVTSSPGSMANQLGYVDISNTTTWTGTASGNTSQAGNVSWVYAASTPIMYQPLYYTLSLSWGQPLSSITKDRSVDFVAMNTTQSGGVLVYTESQGWRQEKTDGLPNRLGNVNVKLGSTFTDNVPIGFGDWVAIFEVEFDDY